MTLFGIACAATGGLLIAYGVSCDIWRALRQPKPVETFTEPEGELWALPSDLFVEVSYDRGYRTLTFWQFGEDTVEIADED